MIRSRTITGLAVLTAALLIAGCGAQTPAADSSRSAQGSASSPAGGASSSGAPADPTEPAGAPAASSAAPATPSPTPQCSGLTGAQALAQWGPQLGVWGMEDDGWSLDLQNADTSTYDECAALSWIVVDLWGGTVSSPAHIMLFHNGQYIGVASAQVIGFHPDVVRLDDSSIQATYRWPYDHESNAEASGRSVSVFTWDDASQSVVHSGEWPPDIQE